MMAYTTSGLIGRIHGQATDGIGAVIVKNRLEGGPIVHGFPYVPACHGNVVFAVILRIYRKISNATRGFLTIF